MRGKPLPRGRGSIVNHPNRRGISPDKWPDYLNRFRDLHNLTQQQLADKLPTPKT
jgi:hypothetical protein